MKLFGKPGSLDSVIGELVAGGVLVELLSVDDGLDVGVDAGQVRAVAGGDPPVLQVSDALFGGARIVVSWCRSGSASLPPAGFFLGVLGWVPS